MRLKSLGQKGTKNSRVKAFASKCHTQNTHFICPVCVAHSTTINYFIKSVVSVKYSYTERSLSPAKSD